MTIALVDVGTTANDGTGDPLRTAFQTVNTALTRLDNTVDVQTGYVLLKDDSGSTGVAVTTAGNVGIGTTTPDTLLHLNGGALKVEASTTGAAYAYWANETSGVLASIFASSSSTLYINTTGTGAIVFAPTGAEAMRVTGSGKVGIGTTTPATPLDVYGANATGAATITAIATGYSDFTPTLNTAYRSLVVKGNNNGYAGITIASPNTGAQSGSLAFADEAAGNAGLITYTHNNDVMTFWSAGVARFAVNSLGDMTWNNAGATVGMTWDASANTNAGGLGIGTTTPTEALDVNSDAIRVRTSQTPASASATGDAGQICWDADYIYVCTATNTWKRAALATW